MRPSIKKSPENLASTKTKAKSSSNPSTKRIKELEEINAGIAKELKQKHLEVAKLRESEKEALHILSQVREQKSEITAKFNDQSKALLRLTEELEARQKEIGNLYATIKRKDETISTRTKYNAELLQKEKYLISAHEVEIYNLKEEHRKNMLSLHEKKDKEIKRDLTMMREQMSEEKRKSDNEIELSSSKINRLEKEIETYSTQIKNLQKQHEDLKTENTTLKSKWHHRLFSRKS